jgi:hypothetical protein
MLSLKRIGWTASWMCRSILLRPSIVGVALALLWPVAAASVHAAPQASVPAAPVSLIYAGWFGNATPTPAFIRTNKTFLESQPFHGLVVYLRDDYAWVNVTTGIMSGSAMSAASITSTLAPLIGLGLTNLRDNFGLVQGSTPPDFFDDWTGTVQNFATLAAALQDAGLRGICFDNEQYSKQWGNYPSGASYPSKTLAEYQTQAQLRGKQVMEAMTAVFPDIAVITLHGPYVSELTAPSSLQFPQWQSGNMLLGPFFAGFVEGAGSAGLPVDGGELYTLRAASDFLNSYNWRKYDIASATVNCPFIPSTLRPSWPTKVSVGFGVYDQPFGGAPMDAVVLKTTLVNSMHQADRYVWYYTEGPSYLLPASSGGASAAWVDAVRQAIATTPPPVAVPAPQSLLALPMASTQVDVSWLSSGTGLTGVKVERKTGSGGTYVQIAQVGSTAASYSDKTVAGNTTYIYRVRASSGATDSPFSPEADATTPAPSAAPSPMPAPAPSGSSGGGGGGCGLLGIEFVVALALLRLAKKVQRTQ